MAAKEIVQKTVIFKSMAADQLALASTEINLDEVPLGQVISKIFGTFHLKYHFSAWLYANVHV